MKNEWTKKLKNLEHRVPPLISKQFIAALFVFSCLGVFVLGWALSFKIEALESIEKEVVYVERLAKSKVKELAVTEKKVVADDYIETIISQLYFLSEDFKKLSTLCMHIPSKNLFAGIQERYMTLAKEENKIQFIKSEEDKHTIWSSKRPVEMSKKDIAQLIEGVEGEGGKYTADGRRRPDIYFSELKFKRAEHLPSDIYLVEMKIIQKREH